MPLSRFLSFAVPALLLLQILFVAGYVGAEKTIYFWDHNWEVTERTPDYENVHFLAENFTAFLGMLYDDPPA